MLEDLVTKKELEMFRLRLLEDMKILMQESSAGKEELKGYKTKDVRRILGCSYNTLVAFRINRKVRAKKELGTWYYDKEDVRKLVAEGFR